MAATAGSEIAVDGRHPEMKREQAELQAKCDENQGRDQNRRIRFHAEKARRDLPHIQCSRDVIERGDADQEHDGAQQVDDGEDQRGAELAPPGRTPESTNALTIEISKNT